jgi:hypothetical protein
MNYDALSIGQITRNLPKVNVLRSDINENLSGNGETL